MEFGPIAANQAPLSAPGESLAREIGDASPGLLQDERARIGSERRACQGHDQIRSSAGHQAPIEGGRPGIQHATTALVQFLAEPGSQRFPFGDKIGDQEGSAVAEIVRMRHLHTLPVEPGTRFTLGGVQGVCHRLIDDGNHRLVVVAKQERRREIGQAKHEILGAVERIDLPAIRRRSHLPDSLLLAFNRMIAKGPMNARENGMLGSQVRLRLQRGVGFRARLISLLLILPQEDGSGHLCCFYCHFFCPA